MQGVYTAASGAVTEGAALEPPISLSEKRESVGFVLFSDFEWVTTVEIFGSTAERSKQLQAMSAGLLHDFSRFQNLAKTLCTTWLARYIDATGDENEDVEEHFTGRS